VVERAPNNPKHYKKKEMGRIPTNCVQKLIIKICAKDTKKKYEKIHFEPLRQAHPSILNIMGHLSTPLRKNT
jgi:hypothetical protein